MRRFALFQYLSIFYSNILKALMLKKALPQSKSSYQTDQLKTFSNFRVTEVISLKGSWKNCQKQSSGGVLYKKMFLKILQNLQKNMCLSLFLNNVLQHYLKRDCDIDVFLWILRNFQEDRFFTEHLRIIAFELFWKF